MIPFASEAKAILGEGAGKALIDLVPKSFLQKNGIFFTDKVLSELVVNKLTNSNNSKTVYDPACGAGDLLLAFSNNLQVNSTLTKTLIHWNNFLSGTDIQEELVKTAQLRIALSAIMRGCCVDIRSEKEIYDVLTNIVCSDGLAENKYYSKASCIITNPPFSKTEKYITSSWGGNNVSTAAVFLDKCINYSETNCEIVAILPDVLRSGSRYKRWRNFIGAETSNAEIIVHGEFNSIVDIDIFILHVTKKQSTDTISWYNTNNTQHTTIGDMFDVHVGSVVPHRDKETGQLRKYLNSRNTPPASIMKHIDSTRRYIGSVHEGPFVVIRRTSSPRDKIRCIPTLVESGETIAIENHLIILKPKDKKLESCYKLFDILKSHETTGWVNKRIRCRHLTVSSVKEIPL